MEKNKYNKRNEQNAITGIEDLLVDTRKMELVYADEDSNKVRNIEMMNIVSAPNCNYAGFIQERK